MVDPKTFLTLPQAQFHVLVSLTDGEQHGYAINDNAGRPARNAAFMVSYAHREEKGSAGAAAPTLRDAAPSTRYGEHS